MASPDTLTGTLSLGVLDGQPVDDPWKRGYLKSPACAQFSTETFPLVDVRATAFPQGLGDRHSPAVRELLRSHGFTAVKHPSALADLRQVDDLATLGDVYYPEIKELVKAVTGARQVFITESLMRSSKHKIASQMQARAADQVKQANGAAPAPAPAPAPAISVTEHETAHEKIRMLDPSDKRPFDPEYVIHVPATAGVGSANVPHLDYAPLGARKCVRKQRTDFYEAVKAAGIVAAEDRICESQGTSPLDASSDGPLAKQYNANGQLGPRYAAYSVWRPLNTVTRDPLAMLPRKYFNAASDPTYSADGHRLVYWPYEVLMPGPQALGGDFLRNLVFLRIDPSDSKTEPPPPPLPFHYLRDQQPDEVLMVKLFDSASLGREAEEADSPFHGSPDLGEKGTGDVRESIEVRVLAIW